MGQRRKTQLLSSEVRCVIEMAKQPLDGGAIMPAEFDAMKAKALA